MSQTAKLDTYVDTIDEIMATCLRGYLIYASAGERLGDDRCNMSIEPVLRWTNRQLFCINVKCDHYTGVTVDISGD